MSGLIPHLSISQSLVFLLNSRLGLFTAASHTKSVRRRPFSRSYRAILPSSLAMIHSSTLGFSPRLPVSVYGTGSYNLSIRGFSRKHAYTNYPRCRSIVVLSGSAGSADLPAVPLPTPFNVLFRQYAWLSLLRHPISIYSQYRNINRFPIDFPSRVRLRPRLTPG